MRVDLDAPEHALCSEALRRERNRGDSYKDLWDKHCQAIAELCTLAGAPHDSMHDVWTLKTRIECLLKAAAQPESVGKEDP